jgi:molecular chaperone GrpE
MDDPVRPETLGQTLPESPPQELALGEVPPPSPEPVLLAAEAAPEPPSAVPDENGGGLPALIARVEATTAAGFADLLQELRDRFALDRFKEEQITKLHDELQAYRNDLVLRPVRQVLQGLIRLHDDLGKVTASLRQKPAGELTPERFFQQFEGFQDDVELLLSQNGVERFEFTGEDFNAHRQTALRTVPTEDPSLVGRIAERLRPGFQQGETLLQKERVAVYAAASARH